MLTLYYAPGACSRASHIALEEAGAYYEAKRVDFSKTEQQSAEYTAINPKARVPSMVTPSGILTETPAILAYIAQTHPDAGLAPLDDPFAFAELQSFNSYLCSTVHVCHPHKARGYRWADDQAALTEMTRKVPETMSACYELIESKMMRGPWAMGETFTVADPYLYTITHWLEGDSVDIVRFPKVQDHFNRMNERPAVKRVMDRERAA